MNIIQPAEQQTGTRRGRPPKGAVVDKRVYRSVGLAQSTWTILEEAAASSGVSVNDAIEMLAIRSRNTAT